MHKNLTDVEKGEIVGMSKAGLSTREIAKKINRNQSTIARLLKKYTDTKKLERVTGSGRPTKLSPVLIKYVLAENKKNKKKSLRKLQNSLAEAHKVKVSHESIRRILHKNGIYAYSVVKKPLLKPVHIKKRLDAANEWITMPDSLLETIIFSDESKFNLFGSDGISSAWRKPGEGLDKGCIKNTVKYGGGSVMVWACFSSKGVGNLYFIEEKMDSELYVNILANNLLTSARKMGLTDFIFQQDNDPKHTAARTKNYLSSNNIRVLTWPPQSPDMNPIEPLWGLIKVKVAEKCPKNIQELKTFILEEWNAISQTTAFNYALSFKKRALELVRKRGGHTDY